MKHIISTLTVLAVLTAGNVFAERKELKLKPQGFTQRIGASSELIQLKPIRMSSERKALDSKASASQTFKETIVEEGVTTTAISSKDFPGFEKTISVDLRGMSVADVLKFLAVEGDLNIAIAPDVTGSVNLLINDVTIRDIFEIILATNRLAYHVQGNVISVISNTEYKILEGVDFFDRRQTVVYQLKFASAQTLGTFLGNVKSDIGKTEDFLEFETLSMCPFELDLIDTDLLTEIQKDWVNNYHDSVYAILGPLLEDSERVWLKDKTRRI